ncbi:DUF2306 domain-containing protein [Sphaerimonospora sp. CA-214678]|uniref:DUF2306 domain-containing protein n=1 Tax=Sphaerimonospora sp. CA-214678 TaxID=3240029 RepID=UPI003D8B9F85
MTLAFLVFTWPAYLTLDPGQARIPLNPGIELHYPLLVTHVAFGSVAMLTGCLQPWRWLRRSHPAVHRTLGRIYVFGGMLPSVVTALVIMPMGALNAFGRLGTTLWGVFALITTLAGYTAARRGDHDRHRRWMIYSFALALAPVSGRLLFFALLAFPGAVSLIATLGMFAGFWLGWIVNLAIAHWWLRRRPVIARR